MAWLEEEGKYLKLNTSEQLSWIESEDKMGYNAYRVKHGVDIRMTSS